MAKYPTTPMCDGTLLEMFEPTVRDSDVLISTTAKCGQTWMQTLLYHLKTKGHSPDLGGKGLMAVSPWLELPPDSQIHREKMTREERLGLFEALDNPRIFKIHNVWSEIPRPPGSKAKIITITRDPREVPYSMFCHLQGIDFKNEADRPSSDFNVYFERWFSLGFYFKFIASFWPHRHDADVLWLRFEDMKADVRGHAERLVSFLGWDVTSDDIDRVLPLVDFKHMQKVEEGQIFQRSTIWKPDARFFREGAVGKNRQQLTEDQERRILERCHSELGAECTEFILSLPN